MNHVVQNIDSGNSAPFLEGRGGTHKSGSEIAMFGIYEISKLLNAPGRLESVLASVANLLSSFLNMRLSMIVILDESGEPDIVATAGGTGSSKEFRTEILPQAVIDQLVATQTPIVVQNIAADRLFASVAEKITSDLNGRVSFLGVPIKAGERVVGTLSIDRVHHSDKPFRIDEDLRFLKMVANLIGQTVRLHKVLSADRRRLMAERSALEKALAQELAENGRLPEPQVGGIVGESAQIRKVMQTIAIVAKSNSTVLLRGESGTGKELFARAVHEMSPRKSKSFVKLNCAALPESVLESELFGHEKGSFTGATGQRQGRFEMANGGTLLLDEIGEISPSFQAKLLRVLQEGEFERVGGNKTLKVDVRLVCATNKDLEAAVSRGEFRADLYYRINVVPVALPPLRDRPGDVRLLARTFLDRFNTENGRKLGFSGTALNVLERCSFPGNVRELENCVRRTATLAGGEVIDRHDFACAKGDCLSTLLWAGGGQHKNPADIAGAPAVREPVRAPTAPVELVDLGQTSSQGCSHAGNGSCPASSHDGRLTDRERLIDAMEKAGWVQAKAARLLGLTPRQIGYALKKQGVELKHL
ncbi:nif-specific transcriptional activator NifA [Roseibium aggregatum]|uniref:nif-specific transcriptional activator NifA n=1 Tax=Roseibium aggregatum TaxID=187304 RepID=UPI003A96EF5E